MKLKVEVVSRESIQPSSPTPHHLRTFKLSFFDQLAAPAVYTPLVLFYNPSDNPGINNDKDNDNKIMKEASSSLSTRFNHGPMKKSLSETLTTYYPMAGRMQDDSLSVIDCNDDGVEYLEARVLSTDNHNNVRFSDVIGNPDIHLLVDQFVPYEPTEFNYSKALLSVQVNVFECGGVVIGAQISHKIADGSSFITFMNDWAAMSRSSGNTTTIPFELLPTLFPQIDLRRLGFSSFTGIKREEIMTKRFVFEAPKIAELKQRSVTNVNGGLDDDNHQEYPTRVEALSAFLWERFINVFGKAKDHQGAGGGGAAVRVYGLSHSVNMRTRMKPPLPANSFGNLACISIGLSHCAEGKKDPYPVLVAKVKDTIKKIDDEHAKKLQNDGPIHYMKHLEQISSSCTVILTFTSFCRFPLYEADFGWGNPEWASIATLPFKNTVALIDTRSRDGVEAWVHLTKEDMAEFERDEELLSFVS